MTQTSLTSLASFSSLGIPPTLIASLAKIGIFSPFPIQASTIPDALQGYDICGKAETGSGKTLAFGLPLLLRPTPTPPSPPASLVLTPTRELAVQIYQVLLALDSDHRLIVIYGGIDIEVQISALTHSPDIIIATPGRLIDLVSKGELDLSAINQLVLDEADRMADMGFTPQVEWILRQLSPTRQTMLFSATLDKDVDRLIQRYMNNPIHHEALTTTTPKSMTHHFFQVHHLDKVKVLSSICRGAPKVLVFVRTKHGADRLVTQLHQEKIAAKAIHGNLTQHARLQALSRFEHGHLPVLVATDVAARGLDITSVDVVVHYDPPSDHKTYLHRSGRTARAGAIGVVATLSLWNEVPSTEQLTRRLGLDNHPTIEVFSNDSRLAKLTL